MPIDDDALKRALRGRDLLSAELERAAGGGVSAAISGLRSGLGFAATEGLRVTDLTLADALAGRSITYAGTGFGERPYETAAEVAHRSRLRELTDKINRLESEHDAKRAQLEAEKQSGKQLQDALKALAQERDEIVVQHRLRFLLDRVEEVAQHKLISDDTFRSKFLGERPIHASVVSIDIRRSTELMLKARTPARFAQFITALCRALVDIVKAHHGVVDKFTGDGVLAFFPDFFSGPEGPYLAVAAAEACHTTFAKHYREARSVFRSVLADVGLGIGIDYGEVWMLEMAGGLTVVGEPVVYACRLGGAPANTTLLNQPAYEMVFEKFSECVSLRETTIDLKHEGPVVAYAVVANGKKRPAVAPEWLEAPRDVPAAARRARRPKSRRPRAKRPTDSKAK